MRTRKPRDHKAEYQKRKAYFAALCATPERKAYNRELAKKRRTKPSYRAYVIATREKTRAKARARYAADPAKYRSQYDLWVANNRERYLHCHRLANKKYAQANKDKVSALWKKKRSQYKAELADTYIKNLLTVKTALRFADIPDSLVALKRAHMKAKHLLNKATP